MAFPTLGVLDAFNVGALQDLTARAGWDASAICTTSSATSMKTDAGPTYAKSPSGVGENAWGTPATDTEVYILCGSTFGDLASSFRLFARLNNRGDPYDAYELIVNEGGSGNWLLNRVSAGTPTTLVSSFNHVVGPTDLIGLEVIGNQLAAYFNQAGGGWVQEYLVTDSTFTGAGAFGMRFDELTSRVNSFGGGSVSVATPTQAGVGFELGANRGAEFL